MSDIIGQKKGGGEQHTHYEATDSLHSISYARVLDLVSEGEILGLAHGMQSVFLNQTPVENADGSTNFKDITVDFRTGTQIQDYIPGFPDVENEIAVGTELRSGTPWTHAVNNLSLSAIRITLSVPALSKGDTTNGDILGYSIAYQIELSTDSGAYAVVLSNSFNGKTTTPYNRSARIDLPAATVGWSIRVTRLTANANTASIADTTTIVSYTEVIDAKLRYPMSAIVGVQVDAKQFQSVPTRAYDLYGRIIQVPTNYDPVTRVYTGIWDGTFKPSWTSNPAWVFRDLVLNDRYGLGARISAAQIDKWALYAIAQYCDQLVPDGKGGTEPRFTCNLYLQSQKAAYAVLQDMASIFRGISYWGGGSIIASSDRPMDPVYVYTAANVIDGKFSRVGSSKKTRATVALVSWNDPADFYRAKVEYVEDQEGIARYGIQQISLTAFGCTSQGQAQRAGRWALATSRLETEAISFEVGMDGAIALPGQIVRIADPARMGRRNGGRVRTAAGRVVTLDKAPIINAGDSLTVILPSGVSETLTVASIDGDAVTVSADWTTVPLAQSVWSVDSSTLMAPTYKILSIKEKGDGLSYAITATQHEPGKFDYIENGTAIVPRPQTSLDVTKQAPPTSVTISAYTVSLQDVQKLAMSVSCAAVAGAVAYEGGYKYGDGNWIPIPRQPSPTLDVVDILPGTYIAKIAAVNSIGITSIETLSVATAITKDGNSKNAAVLLSSSVPAFHINTAGANDPASIAFNATLIALDGPVTFSIVGGTLTSITDTSAVLTFANMSAASASVTASVTVFGSTYSATCGITKMQDGTNGARGPGQYYASGAAWSDTTANSAVVAPKQVNDVVTISNNSTFAQTKKWDGTNWVLLGAVVDPSLLLAASIDLTKFASGIEPVTMVTTVPGSKSTYSIFNTTDGKLYRWNGTTYVATVATTDLSGTLADAQIAALAASKITGTLTNSQIADLAATKLTGQITTTQITDGGISTAKLAANAVTAGKIATDTITANEIAASAITSTELAAGAVVAGKIAAGTIVAADIAANTITAAKIAASTITATELATDSVTAGKIAAAAISAREIAAGAITTTKLAIGDFENLVTNPSGYLNGIVTADGWGNATAGKSTGIFSSSSEPFLLFTQRNNPIGPYFKVNPGDQFYFEFTSQPNGGGAGDYDISLGLVVTGLDPATITSFPISALRLAASTGVQTVSGTYTVPAGVYWAQIFLLVSTFTSSAGFYLKNIQVRRMTGATLIQDGAITTNKILAGAVTADRIAVTDLAAINAELGSAVISTTGSLRSGQTAYDTGTGWWQGFVSGVPKWSIGVGGTATSLKWDGTNLSVGNNVIIGSTAASLIESRANGAVPTPTGFTLTGTFSGTVTNTSTGVLTLTKALSATASGAVGTVSLSWAIAVSDGFPSNFSLSSTTSATPTLTCRSSNQSISIGVTCTATDSSTGLSRVASGIVTFNMGAF